jgi:hypothetical protein
MKINCKLFDGKKRAAFSFTSYYFIPVASTPQGLSFNIQDFGRPPSNDPRSFENTVAIHFSV